MKKLILLTAILTVSGITAFAQYNMEDVVHLKNGSVIRGTILQWIPDSLMKIEIAGGSQFVFKASEVGFYTKEKKMKKTEQEEVKETEQEEVKETEKIEKTEKTKTEIHFNRGFRFGAEGGWIIGSGDNEDKSPLSIHLLSSYHVLPFTAMGVGVGLEFFKTTEAPVYIDLRQYINQKYYAPYLFVQAGYLLPVGPVHNTYSGYNGYQTKGKTGYLFNPGIGVLVPLSEKSDLSISFSYRYQEINSTIDDYYKPNYTLIEKMNRLNFKIGIMLH